MTRRGGLRASDEDRDRIVDRLHKAATEGRIAAEELEQRVSTALKARTYDELESTVDDLPGPAGRASARRHSTVGSWAVSAVRANPLVLLLVIPVVAITLVMLLAVTIVWLVAMIGVSVLGGRHGIPRAPWMYGRRYGALPRRRGDGRHWA